MKQFKFTDQLTNETFVTPFIDGYKIHNYHLYDINFLSWMNSRILVYTEI